MEGSFYIRSLMYSDYIVENLKEMIFLAVINIRINNFEEYGIWTVESNEILKITFDNQLDV